MSSTTRRTALTAALVTTLATASALMCAGTASATADRDPHDIVYVQTASPGGNHVLSYQRDGAGVLHQVADVATGGKGGQLNGSQVDHLASQGSLAFDPAAGIVIATNAGSDTVSVLAVDGPLLTLRQSVPSGGAFPASVTVHGDTAYVLNSADGGSVQGFRIEHGRLAPLPGSHAALGLSTDTGEQQFVKTPGQVAFTDNGAKLVVTTKANGSVKVFDVAHDGTLQGAATTTDQAPGVPFAVVTHSDGRLVFADASGRVTSATLWTDDRVAPAAAVATDQMATCWIARNRDTVYVTNAGSDSISRFRVGADGSLTALGRTSTGAGPTDMTVSPAGDYLYAQTGKEGNIETFRIHADGSLKRTSTITVPGAVGGEGIIAP